MVEQVKHFKYLGTHIDQRLSFTQHGDRVYKKAQQRMCPLRKLKGFVVRKVISLTVYQTLIGSVISFNITSWHSFLASRCQEKLARIIKQANKITSIQQKQLSDLHTQAVERKTSSILLDPSHPFHGCFELLPSGRRYRVPLAKNIARYKILHTQGNTHRQHTSDTSTTYTQLEKTLPSIKDNFLIWQHVGQIKLLNL